MTQTAAFSFWTDSWILSSHESPPEWIILSYVVHNTNRAYWAVQSKILEWVG